MTTRALAFLVGTVLTGCAHGDSGTVVFGITSDFRPGIDLDRLEATLDRTDSSTTQSFTLGSDKGEVGFPLELEVQAAAESRVGVTLHGFILPNTLLIARAATTDVVAEQKLLYRVNLEGKCRFSIAGSFGIEPCGSGTCINGSCVDPYLPPAALEPYDANWPKTAGDICKPALAGSPELTIGGGQSDFKTIQDYDVAQVEAGPQGGYHIWVALRSKNLRRSGSQTEIAGEIPELGMALDPLKVIFTLVPDEGGYCKLYGLRFQLLLGSKEQLAPMLGKALKLSASVSDTDGDVGKAERWVTLSQDFL
jgi:hypothetical protein